MSRNSGCNGCQWYTHRHILGIRIIYDTYCYKCNGWNMWSMSMSDALKELLEDETQ